MCSSDLTKVHPNITRLSLACVLVKQLQHRIASREPFQDGLSESVRRGVDRDAFVVLAEFFHQCLPGFLGHVLNVGVGLLEYLASLQHISHDFTKSPLSISAMALIHSYKNSRLPSMRR